jgi:hypothetical protein
LESDLINELVAICERHVCSLDDVVFSESYVPYVPDQWNRVLVVAEAQNLSKKNAEYKEMLGNLKTSRDRILRLQPAQQRLLLCPKGSIGGQPWDDGILPLAIEAALKDVDPEHVAVSNAVPWSLVTPADTNASPRRCSKSWQNDSGRISSRPCVRATW